MINILLVLMYKLLLDALFFFFIRHEFSHEPYLSQYEDNPSFEKWLLTSVLCIVLWLFIQSLNSKVKRISNFYILVQFFVVVVPSLVLFGMQDRPYFHILLLCSSLCLLSAIVGLAPRIIIPPPPRFLTLSLIVIGLVGCVYVYLRLIISGGIGRLNFDFYSVYEMREEYRDIILPGFGYLLPWVAYVANIAFLIYFFVRKNWYLMFFIIALQVLLFGMTNFKTFLFVPFISLFLIIARQYISLARVMLLGMLIVPLIGIVVTAFGEPMGISLVRRALFVPAGLHGLYFDYFSNMPSSAMSGTRFASFFSAPYDSTSIKILAWVFWEREFNPNVGWVGDAYAQFNWIGVLIYTIIFGAMLMLADNLVASMQLKRKEIEGLFIGPAIALCNSSLTVFMLTHGFLIMLIVLWILNYFWGRRLVQPAECKRHPKLGNEKRLLTV